MKNQSTLNEFFHSAAKAITTFILPYVVLVLNAFSGWIGMDQVLDTGQVSTWVYATVFSAISSAVVYATRNKLTPAQIKAQQLTHAEIEQLKRVLDYKAEINLP